MLDLSFLSDEFPLAATSPPIPNRQYELTVRQEPKQARMCGVGGKGAFILLPVPNLLLMVYVTADRRPIDPPIIVQLRVIDPAASPSSSTASSASSSSTASTSSQPPTSSSPHSEDTDEPTPRASPTPTHSTSSPTSPGLKGDDAEANLAGYAQSFLQNPYYFMFASLAKPDDDKELHWLKVCLRVFYFPLFFSGALIPSLSRTAGRAVRPALLSRRYTTSRIRTRQMARPERASLLLLSSYNVPNELSTAMRASSSSQTSPCAPREATDSN